MYQDKEDEVFSELITEALANIEEDVEEGQREEAVQELLDELVDVYYQAISETRDDSLSDWRKEIQGFRERLNQDWRLPIDLLEAFIMFCQEIGMDYSDRHQEEAVEEDDLVHIALIQLHGRACVLAREILTLIKGGFADGAHARWRSLHEVVVVAQFIRNHGRETAKRFLLHSHIYDYYQMEAIQQSHEEYGTDPVPEEQMEDIEAFRESLLDNIGSDFDGLWGWASEALGNPNFKKIEEDAGFGHLHPFYVFASKANIHSGSKGTFYQIGNINSPGYETIAAPTNYGFTMPGTHTARSLNDITKNLLTYHSDLEDPVHAIVGDRLVQEIEDAFPEAKEIIEKRHEEYWDQYLEEFFEEAEKDLEAFKEELDEVNPPIVKIELDENLDESDRDGEDQSEE